MFATEWSTATINQTNCVVRRATARPFTAASESAWVTGTSAMAPLHVPTLKTSATASGWVKPTATWERGLSRFTRPTRSSGSRHAFVTGSPRNLQRKSARCLAIVQWTRAGWCDAAQTTRSRQLRTPRGSECRSASQQTSCGTTRTATTTKHRLWPSWRARTSSAAKFARRGDEFPKRESSAATNPIPGTGRSWRPFSADRTRFSTARGF